MEHQTMAFQAHNARLKLELLDLEDIPETDKND